jgi:1-deoxy-D-xylulose-5-phosphate reductoisomerase
MSASPQRRKIAILGSTGSIGTQALDVVRHFPDRFEITALTANQNMKLLAEQAREWKPSLLVAGSEEAREELQAALGDDAPEIALGEEGLCQAVGHKNPESVIIATVGFAGVAPTLKAAESGVVIALANKEALVCAGSLIMDAAKASGASLLPVDSEHNGLFQCLAGQRTRPLENLILTASGGPFRTRPRSELRGVSRVEVLNHPNWEMGQKITVDSATMMNKGFEVIEAMWLFNVTPDRIKVVIHPQSTVHALVEYADGSIIAQMGAPDMRNPIQYVMLYPESQSAPWPKLDVAQLGQLDFQPVDFEQFPLLNLAYRAAKYGSRYGAILNAVNEEAVGAFLDSQIGFIEMQELIIDVMTQAETNLPAMGHPDNFEELKQLDAQAREMVTIA